mmetsp:Transcript_23547/g.65297  ORF Transcript_23547/g.65297 Transcript_23547/m.65297 type:complete len:158 (-) Transcript_23547:181-654(-)
MWSAALAVGRALSGSAAVPSAGTISTRERTAPPFLLSGRWSLSAQCQMMPLTDSRRAPLGNSTSVPPPLVPQAVDSVSWLSCLLEACEGLLWTAFLCDDQTANKWGWASHAVTSPPAPAAATDKEICGSQTPLVWMYLPTISDLLTVPSAVTTCQPL